jgi:hypothetical protein
MICYINVSILTLACFLYMLANTIPNGEGLSFVNLKCTMSPAVFHAIYLYKEEEHREGCNRYRLCRFAISNLLHVFLKMSKIAFTTKLTKYYIWVSFI